MQAPDPAILSKVLDLLVSPATSIAAIYVYDRFIASKRNGGVTKEALQETKDALKEATEAISKALDFALTKHFDQLRRDLSTTIDRAHSDTRKDSENQLSRFLADLELFVLRRPPQ